MRKKLSEMTLPEKLDRFMEGKSWDDAEDMGVELLARCMALHVYARKEGSNYMQHLLSRICERGDEWAHEGNHPAILALAAVAHQK